MGDSVDLEKQIEELNAELIAEERKWQTELKCGIDVVNYVGMMQEAWIFSILDFLESLGHDRQEIELIYKKKLLEYMRTHFQGVKEAQSQMRRAMIAAPMMDIPGGKKRLH